MSPPLWMSVPARARSRSPVDYRAASRRPGRGEILGVPPQDAQLERRARPSRWSGPCGRPCALGRGHVVQSLEARAAAAAARAAWTEPVGSSCTEASGGGRRPRRPPGAPGAGGPVDLAGPTVATRWRRRTGAGAGRVTPGRGWRRRWLWRHRSGGRRRAGVGSADLSTSRSGGVGGVVAGNTGADADGLVRITYAARVRSRLPAETGCSTKSSSVAVFSASDFNARTVDPKTVCFGDAEDPTQRDCTERTVRASRWT